MPHDPHAARRLGRSSVRAAAVGSLALLALAATTRAHAESAAEPEGGSPAAELDVSLSGPSTGTAGGTGNWSITVTNTGGSAATAVRVATELPPGITVSSVTPTDDWDCVLGAGLSCQLQGGFPPRRSAEVIPMVLAYDKTAVGSKQLAADAYQGEAPDEGMRIDRGTATVVLSAPPEPATPSPAPSPAPKVTTAPATTGHVTTRTAATRPVVRSAPARVRATSSADVVAAPAVTASAEPTPTRSVVAPDADQPETLPFTDEASAPRAPDDGVSPLLLLLLLAAGIVLVGGAVAAVWTIRRRGTTA